MRQMVLIAILCCTTQAAVAQDQQAVEAYVVELDVEVVGRDRVEYVNRWWQWAYSMPQRDSPVRDRDGHNCALNQSDGVWFLAGGFGTSKITRSCDVPTDQHLFFPLINMIVYTPPGAQGSCASVKANVAANNDRYVYLRVSLNGEQIKDAERFRVASQDCFDPLARVPAEYAPPSFAPAATDGYWMMLRPLPAGTHELAFSAFYTNQDNQLGDMVQNISYTLTVLPE